MRISNRAIALALVAILIGGLAGCAAGLLPSASPTASPTPIVPSASPTEAIVSPTPNGSPWPTPTDAIPTPTDAIPTPTRTPGPTVAPGTATPFPAEFVHVVAPGDTLSAIALRYATTIVSIGWWNRSAYPSLDPTSRNFDPNRIEVGWRLTIRPGVVVDEDDLPTAPPPTPVPTASIPPVPSPTPGTASVLLSHGSRTSKVVALTFDMGGRLDPALAITDWLIANRVPATIFSTGATGSGTTIGRAVLGRIKANPSLFSFGNHTWDHPDLTKLTAAQIKDQLTRTENALAPLAGRSTVPFLRPPFGAVNSAVRTAVGAAGWGYTVMWDVDTIDWRPVADGGPTADEIVAKVVTGARGGSIVLMHLGGYNTLAALPRIVAGLRARGLEPVTLDRLVGR